VFLVLWVVECFSGCFWGLALFFCRFWVLFDACLVLFCLSGAVCALGGVVLLFCCVVVFFTAGVLSSGL
jgi:hypothetical protein